MPSKIREDRDQWVGEYNVKIVSWKPAFALIDFGVIGGVRLENVHTSDEAHAALWQILRSKEGRLVNGVDPYENLWKVKVRAIDGTIFNGPNHCGLQVETIEWIGEPPTLEEIRENFQERKANAWEQLLSWFGYND